ncbi:nickel pincer cofactor biosynthesis protein LarC [Clostridium felsineum]|uniref:nickel pincer cofactor biosynthesis protein LarC n=1 Tax=Clostridium felsineum TaxID=36839 RepID=UPI00098C79CF|nr:nickel pincer cofactor biosynthesis protein LarC [Clostridium felsineum]URZ17479.1 Pyridinium-3,5-bisthiocarboxylic acid mononucleotide nickel insertion protein [Clostridium felsineum DSM 794]
MKILYYDCFCGISGDMNLAALIDLGVPKNYLIDELSKLKLSSEYEMKIEKSQKLGITGTRVDVILKNEVVHNENHKHQHHDHEGHHHHRGLKDIEEIINSSDLSNKVKKLSLDMFMKVAEAEAKVHGKDLYEVHFHEVGAIDSIVDIVGAAICLDYLNVDKILASKVQVGGGFVKCAHGVMPVPAPATVEILRDIPINTGIVKFETTTPTGAAILAANVKEFTEKLDFKIKNTAYGIGHRDLEIPNVLRVYLGEGAISEKAEGQYIIETNIDDMNPELYGYLEEKLFSVGALDVFKTPIFMKKSRAGIKLSVLTDEKSEKKVLDIIFKESTSIGVRKYKVEKIMLKRTFEKVKTEYGDITIKKAYYNGELVKYKPEYEECKAIAKEKDVTIDSVYKAVYKKLN